MVNRRAGCDSLSEAGICRPPGKAEGSHARLGSTAPVSGGATGSGTRLPLRSHTPRAPAQPYRAAVRAIGIPSRDRPRDRLLARYCPADAEVAPEGGPERSARAGLPTLVTQATHAR